ncbi:MAG: hypothetical protein DDT35_00856 [Firmicutes bacterium]|nr:hypothetical protein [Bacillota bacterium]
MPCCRVRGVRLNSLGIAEVDFTREIYAHGASATAETAVLGAVLHNLSELPGVQGVRFTVEGRAWWLIRPFFGDGRRTSTEEEQTCVWTKGQ